MPVLAQTTAPVDGSFERLGVASILVIAAYYMIKYFIVQLAKKDDEIKGLTQKFIETTENFAKIAQSNTTTMAQVTATMANVDERMQALTDQFRMALGDAIIGAAHEAVKGAREIAAGVPDQKKKL